MRKQYTFHAYAWGCYVIELYHDGVMTHEIKKDRAEVDRYINRLEAQGYTFGYTDKGIEETRKTYEHMLENRIGPEVETYDGEWLDVPDYGGSGWWVDGKQIYPKSCSICGDVYSKVYKHCPNCGAKMKAIK